MIIESLKPLPTTKYQILVLSVSNPHHNIPISSVTLKSNDILEYNHHKSTQKENRVAFLLRGFYTYDRL